LTLKRNFFFVFLSISFSIICNSAFADEYNCQFPSSGTNGWADSKYKLNTAPKSKILSFGKVINTKTSGRYTNWTQTLTTDGGRMIQVMYSIEIGKNHAAWINIKIDGQNESSAGTCKLFSKVSSLKTPADYAARCNISVANVKMAQRRLKKLGLYTSTIDGIAGESTERAFKAAKAKLGTKASAGECFNKADIDAFLLIEQDLLNKELSNSNTNSSTGKCSIFKPRNCGAAKLCRRATFYKLKKGKRIKKWSASKSQAYVREAKRRNLSCGIAAKKPNYAKRCNLSVDNVKEIQRRLKKLELYTSVIDGIAGSGTQTAIKKAKAKLFTKASPGECFNQSDVEAFKVIEAKLLEKVVPKVCTIFQAQSDPKGCTDDIICKLAVYSIPSSTGSIRRWKTLNYSKKVVQEAKKRGLTCGMKVIEPNCSSDNLDACSDIELCTKATNLSNGVRSWKDLESRFVERSKGLGLDCGITVDSTPLTQQEAIYFLSQLTDFVSKNKTYFDLEFATEFNKIRPVIKGNWSSSLSKAFENFRDYSLKFTSFKQYIEDAQLEEKVSEKNSITEPCTVSAIGSCSTEDICTNAILVKDDVSSLKSPDDPFVKLLTNKKLVCAYSHVLDSISPPKLIIHLQNFIIKNSGVFDLELALQYEQVKTLGINKNDTSQNGLGATNSLIFKNFVTYLKKFSEFELYVADKERIVNVEALTNITQIKNRVTEQITELTNWAKNNMLDPITVKIARVVKSASNLDELSGAQLQVIDEKIASLVTSLSKPDLVESDDLVELDNVTTSDTISKDAEIQDTDTQFNGFVFVEFKKEYGDGFDNFVAPRNFSLARIRVEVEKKYSLDLIDFKKFLLIAKGGGTFLLNNSATEAWLAQNGVSFESLAKVKNGNKFDLVFVVPIMDGDDVGFKLTYNNKNILKRNSP